MNNKIIILNIALSIIILNKLTYEINFNVINRKRYSNRNNKAGSAMLISTKKIFRQ
jgi:hypothetical protein